MIIVDGFDPFAGFFCLFRGVTLMHHDDDD